MTGPAPLTRRGLLGSFLAAPATTALAGSAPSAPGFRTPRFGADGTRTFPNLVLHDQDGRRLLFHDDLIRGRVFAATFGYVKCTGICGRMAANLAAAADLLGPAMGHPVRFYTFSLAEDSPADMKRAMQDRGLEGRPGWTYLTGSAGTIREIRHAFGFFDRGGEDTLGSPGTHTGMVRFGHHALDKWSACPSLGPPASIAKSILWLFPADRRPAIAGPVRPEGSGGTPIPGFVTPEPLRTGA